MKNWLIILFLILSSSLYSQTEAKNKKTKKIFSQAIEYYENGDTINSMILCNKAITLEPDFTEPYVLKAQIYSIQGNYTKAIENLKISLKISQSYYQLYYILGTYLMNIDNYIDAVDYFNKYLNYETDTSNLKYAISKKQLCEFRIYLLNNPLEFNPVRISNYINTTNSEYFPTITAENNTLLFTRQVDKQEDIFVSHKIDDSWKNAVSVSPYINTDENEGAHCLSADGMIMIFTRCSSYGSCDLYYTEKDESGFWMNPVPFGNEINTRYWETQPSLSPDYKTLYFVSNRPGGFGKMDIWCSKFTNGKWSAPFNLGKDINTPGNEMSPFLHFDNKTFYFVSDYLPGLGGFDIFISKKIDDTTWEKPKNIGYPINSKENEYRLVVDAVGKTGYFSSERDTNFKQDIYCFELDSSIKPQKTLYVKANIYRIPDNKKITADNITFVNLKNYDTVFNYGNISEFFVCLPKNQEFALNILTKGYLMYSENYDLSIVADSVNFYEIDIFLMPIIENSLINLKNIFFETDSYNINPKSYVELDKIVEFLKINPSVEIQVSGHTDSIGTYAYNISLSEKRAKSVKEYLVTKGIDDKRITYKGYGFTKPVTDNQSEEGRKLNRRTEIVILKK